MSLFPVVAAALLAGAPGAAAPVDFIVTPRVGAAGLERLEFSVRFEGDADGETELALPDRWAGTSGLHAAIGDLAVAGGTLAETGDPARRAIRHAPGAPLTVRYSLGPSAADPGLDYEKARPVLRPGWFYVHGEGALAVPAGRGAAPARFRWGPAPPGWQLAGNLDGAPAAGLTVDDAVQSILAGGADLRFVDRDVDGRTIRVAMRGRWSFSAEAFADALARVIAAENLYMASPAIPYFVSLIPLAGGESGSLSVGGTGRTGGFALASTTNVELAYLLRVLAHEYGHRWFGRELGPTPDPDAPEYWFTEGYNDFVAAQSLVAAGLWSERDYADSLNETLLRYAQSSARALPNAELAAAYWRDEAAMQMVYDRGHLFALVLAGQAPAGALRTTLARMAAEAGSFPAGQTEAARFAAAFTALPPDRLAGQMEAAIFRGEPIALPAGLFAACGTVIWLEQPVYASGYTAEDRPDGRFFATVDPAGPAWAAGLRPGMRYVRRESFRPRDSSTPIVMRVADAGGERVLSWLPQGRETVRFQRLDLRPFADAADAARCRASLSGG